MSRTEELISSLIVVSQLARDEKGKNKRTLALALDTLHHGLLELEQLNREVTNGRSSSSSNS